MSWRDATVADLLRGRSGAALTGAIHPARLPHRRPAARRAPFGERVLDGTRGIAVLAAVSVIVLILTLPVVTLVSGMAAGSRLLAADRAGAPCRPVRDTIAFLRQTMATTWPVSVGLALGLTAVGANLLFLSQQPTVLAATLVAVNLAALAIGNCWGAACVRELADAPTLSRPALLRAATARATRPSRWHLAVAIGVLMTIALVLLSPLVAAFFGPALALLLGRLADPHPGTGTASTIPGSPSER